MKGLRIAIAILLAVVLSGNCGAQAREPVQKTLPPPTRLSLACSVMLTVPLVDQNPSRAASELTPVLPYFRGGPSFQKYYIDLDMKRNAATLYLTNPDNGSKLDSPWIEFSSQLGLSQLRDHADYYLLDNGRPVHKDAPANQSLVFWVDRTTGWFELVTTYISQPYPSKSWEVGVCGERKRKF